MLGLVLMLLSVQTLAAPTENLLTRGELAQMLMELFELEYDEGMTTSFEDVPRESPYYEAVSVMFAKGIISGTSSTTFGVDDTLTRAEAATILYRMGIPDGTPETLPTDVSDTAWMTAAVYSVLAHGVMTVKEDGKFYPYEPVYPSEINTSVFDALFGPTTTGLVQFDLIDGSITVSRNIKGVTVFEQGGEAIRTEGNSAIIRQSIGTPSGNTVTVQNGDVMLTIVDLSIESEEAPISISGGAKLTLNLMGSSRLQANGNYAEGISVFAGGELVILGSGALTATGGEYCSSGIGGISSVVTINSGTVTAIGGKHSGAGLGGKNETITINGGNVTASGIYGAGIGGEKWEDNGVVTINGGTVTASSSYGAGIGGGYGGRGGTVTIYGGVVTAKGDYHAIGGGEHDNEYGCDSITIADNASVTAECYYTDTYSLERFTPYQERIDYDALLDTAALMGSSALFSLNASGYSGLSYQWQESADNENWRDIDGQTAATAAIPMSGENDGYYYRCRLVNGWGNEVYTDSARAYVLAFTQQPEGVESGIGDAAVLKVTSSCVNVTYQWQRSLDDGASWVNVSGEIYSTLLVGATLSENDALYRCVITATNGDSLASDVARLTVSGGGTTYTTRFYLERADGSGYDLAEQLVTEASAGSNVTAGVRTFDHYSENTAKGTLSGTVREDSSLVLSRYYDRVSYTLTYETNGGAALGTDSVKYGTALTLPTPSKVGCTFAGWYWDEGLTRRFEETAMPGESLTLYAGWSIIGEGRGIEYQINGITLRDSSYQKVSAIPRGMFYAEVSVTNLSSTNLDTLILATYDASGRQLGLSFLYANPHIGQTFVLGASIDNSRGEVATIKAFLLPLLGGLTPLAESAELTPST